MALRRPVYLDIETLMALVSRPLHSVRTFCESSVSI
jgi:hypothetical protein